MKSRILIIITSLLVGALIFSGCKSEDTTPENLEEDVKALQELKKSSENLENTDDAFTLMRELNQTMKGIRDKVLSMDANYNTATEEEKKKMEKEFEDANKKIDKSLKTIKENIKPYEEDEEVSKMIQKLNEILISK
ncbi:MAG: hypothetical protein ACLFUW_10710 [Bacteroidales bacterium]